MTEQRLSPILHDLVSEMVRMLITYEMELEAYSLVLRRAQENFIHEGIPWDMESNLRKIVGSPALAAAAEAEYASFFGLLERLTPENLQIALAAIKRKLQKHEDSVPPDPE